MEGRKNLYTYYYTDEASRLTNAIHCVFSIDLKMFYFSMWKTNWLIALYLFCHIYWKMKKDHRDSNAISHEIEFDYMLQMRNKQTNYTDETNPTSRTNWHTWNFLHDIILCVCTFLVDVSSNRQMRHTHNYNESKSFLYLEAKQK